MDKQSPLGTLASGVEPGNRRHWTVAQVLRGAHTALRLRERVRKHPLFESVTLGQLIDDPLSLDRLLAECRLLPQCGETQIARLRQVLGQEIRVAMAAPASPAHGAAGAAPDAAALNAPAGTALKFEGDFHPDCMAALEGVYLRMWRLAQFDPFVYLPTSVPEFVKIPAVLAAEAGPGRDVAAYSGRLAALLNALPSMSRAEGVILLDTQALGALLARHGRYAALTTEDVAMQVAGLRAMLAGLPPGIDCRLLDFERAQLSSLTLVGEYLVFYAMGGYGVLRNPPNLAQLRARCRAAQTAGGSLSEFLEAHDGQA